MQIETVPIESIRAYRNNAKIHTPEQISQIALSIVEFGNNDPIAVDENGVIIEGHGRWLALQQLGHKTCEIIRIAHLTEEQKKAYILVHNKLTMNTGFDFNILDAELAEITNIDMTEFSFEQIDISPFDFGTDFTLNDSSTPLVRTLSMSFTPEQYAIWTRAIAAAKAEGLRDPSDKTNEDCNAVAEIVRQWLEEREMT